MQINVNEIDVKEGWEKKFKGVCTIYGIVIAIVVVIIGFIIYLISVKKRKLKLTLKRQTKLLTQINTIDLDLITTT